MTTTVEILTRSPFNSDTYIDGQKIVIPGETRILGWKVYSAYPNDHPLDELEVTNINNMTTVIKAGQQIHILERHNEYREFVAKSLLPKGDTIFRVTNTIPNLHLKPVC